MNTRVLDFGAASRSTMAPREWIGDWISLRRMSWMQRLELRPRSSSASCATERFVLRAALTQHRRSGSSPMPSGILPTCSLRVPQDPTLRAENFYRPEPSGSRGKLQPFDCGGEGVEGGAHVLVGMHRRDVVFAFALEDAAFAQQRVAAVHRGLVYERQAVGGGPAVRAEQ